MSDAASPTKNNLRTRRDWPLAAMIAAAVIVMILIAIPFLYSMRMIYRFHVYEQDLAASFVYGEENKSLMVTADGRRVRVKKPNASRLYEKIITKGMGHPRKEVPEGPYDEALTLEFGDGSQLLVRKVEIREKKRENDTGVLLRYTRTDGEVFMYDTDLLQYEGIAEVLGL